MSFGFSAGDFLATARLVNDLVRALRSSSVSEFRELAVELENVQRALYDIEHLQPLSGQESTVNGIKIAALLCKHPLDEFAAKLKKYDALGQYGLTGKDQIRKCRLKLSWGLTMEEEVQRIRTILSAHMASLNVRLSTLGLISTSLAAREIEDTHDKLDHTQEVVLGVEKDTRLQRAAIQESNGLLRSIARIVQSSVLPQMTILLDIANRVWTSNMQILNILNRLHDQIPAPDIKHTYLQAPCKFEDALGRPLTVPPEYDLELLRAIISAKFRTGPGSEKVLANEYEIFNTSDTTQLLSESTFRGLIPGMKITMAFVIGRYNIGPLRECPRPGCRTRVFNKVHAGGQTCSACEVWFDMSRQSLPRPFRLGSSESVFQRLRAERKWFKNVRICTTEIPKLPPTSDHLGMWVKMGQGQNSTQAMLAEVDTEIRNRNPRNCMSSFEISPDTNLCLRNRETAAAQAITKICEELYISVDELKDLCFNDFEPGTLGIDSLLTLAIVCHLKDLGINLRTPDNGKTSFFQGLFFEAFLKDFVNEYWYCLGKS